MISDLSKKELSALARVVELWDEIWTVLSTIDAHPQSASLHIDSELYPGYLGWVGWNEGGDITFQPAPAEGVDDD